MTHGQALMATLIWSVTFVSTKHLLADMTPFQIMLIRFGLAYFILFLIYPKDIRYEGWTTEGLFLLTGLSGVSLYFFVENTAVHHTSIANLGFILAMIPIFVAFLSHYFFKDEQLDRYLWFGFILAIGGVALIIYSNAGMKLSPKGDFMAFLACVLWAFYSVLVRRLNQRFKPIYITRKTFFYGLLTGILFVWGQGQGFGFEQLLKHNNWLHLMFLGILASAVSFVLWNNSIRLLGPAKTSNYLYLMPFFSMIAGHLFLGETITIGGLVGGVLVIGGVYFAERRPRFKRPKVKV